jgi:hypothetical protein
MRHTESPIEAARLTAPLAIPEGLESLVPVQDRFAVAVWYDALRYGVFAIVLRSFSIDTTGPFNQYRRMLSSSA